MFKILHSMIVRMIRMYKKRKKKIFKISQAQVSQESDVSFIEDRNHVCWRREVFPRGFRGVARGASRMNGLEIFERRSAAVELGQ